MKVTQGRIERDTNHSTWNLDINPDSVRTVEGFEDFETEYEKPPVVHLSLIGFDISNNTTSSRLGVKVIDVKENGFKWSFSTWGDTLITGITCSWIAIGK